eukprot:5506014-Pyramimonas_sp.AAC.1
MAENGDGREEDTLLPPATEAETQWATNVLEGVLWLRPDGTTGPRPQTHSHEDVDRLRLIIRWL